jgi:hypothetical protein
VTQWDNQLINISRNSGDETASSAAIPIDAAFQDLSELIIEIIAKWKEDYEVVLARMTDRESGSFFKR